MLPESVIEEIKAILSHSNWIVRPGFRYSKIQGYHDYTFGCRAGPSYDFDNLAHEIAHACALGDSELTRLNITNYDLAITSGQEIMGRWYVEPETIQATALECRVMGIQKHILESVNEHIPDNYCVEKATILADFMPDWIFGGPTKKERIHHRATLIQDAYASTDLDTIKSQWVKVCDFIGQQLI